jgi:hypothetical protein
MPLNLANLQDPIPRGFLRSDPFGIRMVAVLDFISLAFTICKFHMVVVYVDMSECSVTVQFSPASENKN